MDTLRTDNRGLFSRFLGYVRLSVDFYLFFDTLSFLFRMKFVKNEEFVFEGKVII